MSLGAGDLKQSVVIQRATVTQNEFNEDVESWADFYRCRARREDASSGEKDAAGQVGAFLMSRFAVRRSNKADSIEQTDRLIHEGTTWSIHDIMRMRDDPDRFLEIKAVRDADNGS
jgi:head-tail adaptor